MKSFLSYLGGKSQLTSKIIPLIPSHHCYVEVFAGAAWMLFRKPESQVEIINDINTELVTLYRVIQHHLEEFIRQFKWQLVSRDEFKRLRESPPETLTDIQRAARFYYLMRTGFAAKVHKPSFASAPSQPPRLNLLRIEEDLSEAHMRLSRVTVENQHFARIIERFDRPDTFFYCDPPYYGHEKDYGEVFSREDFGLLRERLAGIKGRFLVSLNDRPEVRELFKGFKVDAVKTTYTAAGANRKKSVGEVLIRNF